MIAAGLSVAEDARWLALNRSGLSCACGERHVGLFPIHLLAPFGWTGARDYRPDALVQMDGDFLSENFCCWQGQYFGLRMRLPVPVQGVSQSLLYTVWAQVSRADFEMHVAARTAKAPVTTHAQARLASRINGYADTTSLSGIAFPQADGGPPLLAMAGPQPGADPRHALITEQRNGVGMDRVLELYAGYGHDMRPGQRTATTH